VDGDGTQQCTGKQDPTPDIPEISVKRPKFRFVLQPPDLVAGHLIARMLEYESLLTDRPSSVGSVDTPLKMVQFSGSLFSCFNVLWDAIRKKGKQSWLYNPYDASLSNGFFTIILCRPKRETS